MKNSRDEAARLRDLVAAWRRAGQIETETMLALAVELHRIRKAYGEDDVAFGSWLQSKHIEIGRNDRAALIRIGEHPVISAEVLGRTKLRSPELIWRREISKLIKKSPEPEQPETQPETEVTVTCPLSDHLIEPPPAAAPGTDFRTVSGTEQEAARSQAMVQQARLTAEFRTMKRAAMAAEEAAERGRAQEHAARDAEAIEGVPELAADLRSTLEPAIRLRLARILASPDAIAALLLLLRDIEEGPNGQFAPPSHLPPVAIRCPTVGDL